MQRSRWIAMCALIVASMALGSQAVAQQVQYRGSLLMGHSMSPAPGSLGNPLCQLTATPSGGGGTNGMGGPFFNHGRSDWGGIATVVANPTYTMNPDVIMPVASYVDRTCATEFTMLPPFATFRAVQSNIIFPQSAGTLMGGGGPVAGVRNPAHGGSAFEVATVTNGVNQFGGVLRVAGSWVNDVHLTTGMGLPPAGDIFENIFNNQFPAGNPSTTDVGTGPGVLQIGGTSFTNTQSAFGLPWTTGTVMVMDQLGQISSVRTQMGYDNRNSAGTSGTLQMVSGMLLVNNNSLVGAPTNGLSGTAILRLQFLPEPGATAALAVGVLSLTAIRLRSRRREN